MGASKEQPSILEALRGKSSCVKPEGDGGSSVNTLTGSVKVAASQSNTVLHRPDQRCPGDSLESSAKPEECQSLESSAKPGASPDNRVGSSKLESSAKPEDSLPNACLLYTSPSPRD